MCFIIVDVDVAARVLLTPGDPDFGVLNKSLFGRKRPNPILAYGGHLSAEYFKSHALKRTLVQLDRAGRAHRFPDAAVDAAAQQIAESGIAESNDHHVLGLARVSGARVLCSADNDLRRDFRKRSLLNPKGKLYSRAAHSRILSHNC